MPVNDAEVEPRRVLPSQTQWLSLDLRIPPADGTCKLRPPQEHNEKLLEKIDRLEKTAELSLKDRPPRSRVQRAVYGVTIDWYNFKKGK
jgi:hypothetical protein